MQSAGRQIWESLVETYYNFSELAITNLLWLVFTIPLVTAAPAAAGLYYATNQLAHQNLVTWRTFFAGFRTHFWLGWRWGLSNLLVLTVLGVNFWFYGQVQTSWADWVRGICLGLMGLWSLLQLYTFPLLLEQEDRRMRTAVRNSLVFFIRRPGFSISLSLFLVLAAVVSTLLLQPFWLLLTASLCAYLANRAAIYLIKDLQSSQHGEV